jgi:[acyl-carrier-protein] S-malonyltransferase
MGKELAENFPVARQVFEEADDALGFAISRLCFDGPAEDLQLTENTQPAILTVSVAAFRAMQEAGIVAPAFVAGHSLGEYSALVAAGALSLADAVRTVRARGRYMQEAVAHSVISNAFARKRVGIRFVRSQTSTRLTRR